MRNVTPGPWSVHGQSSDNFDFIAHARDDVPWLLEQLTAANAEIERLRAQRVQEIGEAGGGSWSRKDRPRIDHHPTQLKLKWERTAT